MSRKTHIQLVGRQEEHEAHWRREALRELAWRLRREWRDGRRQARLEQIRAAEAAEPPTQDGDRTAKTAKHL